MTEEERDEKVVELFGEYTLIGSFAVEAGREIVKPEDVASAIDFGACRREILEEILGHIFGLRS